MRIVAFITEPRVIGALLEAEMTVFRDRADDRVSSPSGERHTPVGLIGSRTGPPSVADAIPL